MNGLDSKTPFSVSAVVVNYRSGTLLLQCLSSLYDQGISVQTVIVDNSPGDGSVEAACEAFPHIEVVTAGDNLGFAAAANLGATLAQGDILLFLNPDARLEPGCLKRVIDTLRDEGVGVAGPAIQIGSSGTKEYGATIDGLGTPIGLLKPRPPFFIPGCVLATRREIFERFHGFDDRLFMFAEDLDYCWRLQLAGLRIRVVPTAKAFHIGGASAPGGYPSDEGFFTTTFRIRLRERNTLAVLIKCYGPTRVSIAVVGYLTQAVLSAALLLAAGSPQGARAVIGAIPWNLKELGPTLKLRRRAQLERRISDREIRRRMYSGWGRLRALMRFGIPEISEKA